MRTFVLAALACAAGCYSEYAYAPAENATAQLAGRAAAHYDIPPESPRGDVRIASFGIAKLRETNDDVETGGKLRAMHVRLSIANNSDPQPWLVDTREQIAIFKNGEQETPVYAQADEGQPPVITIQQGQRATIDVFYPLPAEAQHARKLPAFDVLWRVREGGRVIAERTPFERLVVEPQYAYAGAYDPFFGPWGPYGWYDPFFFGTVWGPRHHPHFVGRPTWRY